MKEATAENIGRNPMIFRVLEGVNLWPRGNPQPSRPGRLCVIINAVPKLRVELFVPPPYRTPKEASKHLEASKCTGNPKFMDHEPR